MAGGKPGFGSVAGVAWPTAALLLALTVGLGGCAAGGTTSLSKAGPAPSPGPSRRTAVAVAAAATGPVHYRNRVVVLMFHNLGANPQGDTVAPATFAADLAALKADGFNAVGAARFASFLRGRGTVPPNAYLITFDDGYEGVYRYAYPLLLRYHDPALLFLVAGWVGQRSDRLTWPQVRTMLRSDLITVGSHTYNSHGAVAVNPTTSAPATVAPAYNWTTRRTETAAQYRARLYGDLTLAEAAFFTNLGSVPAYFAYPFGAYDQPLIQILHREGYRYLFSTLGGANAPGGNPDAIFRINVGTPWVTPASLVQAVIDTGRGPVYRAPPAWCQPWCAAVLKNTKS